MGFVAMVVIDAIVAIGFVVVVVAIILFLVSKCAICVLLCHCGINRKWER